MDKTYQYKYMKYAWTIEVYPSSSCHSKIFVVSDIKPGWTASDETVEAKEMEGFFCQLQASKKRTVLICKLGLCLIIAVHEFLE